MDKEKDGFPLTAIREVNILLSFHHAAIVDVSEVRLHEGSALRFHGLRGSGKPRR